MEGVVELAESIFQTSVIPNKFSGMESILQNPIYATSIGLVDHGFKQMNEGLIAEKNQSWLSKLLNIVKSEYWFYISIPLECVFLGFY